MFDETQPQNPQTPMSGPPPGQPLPSMGAAMNRVPISSMVSPERTPPLPPLPPEPRMSGGSGRGKKLLLWLVLALIVVGGGIAAAALLFPTRAPTTNANGNVNTTNAVTTSNTNRMSTNGTYSYGTNAAANTNAANTNTNASNANVNTGNTNAARNVNGTTSASGNANTNVSAANTNSSASNTNTATRPASYSTDTDGDALNDYLEQWLQTSAKNNDADGDTFQDGSEVVKGFSPLSPGKLSVTGFKQYCAGSVLVTQHAFPASDADTLCKLGGDILTNVQVMATNAQFFTDLDAQLASGCASFGKLTDAVCTDLVKTLIADYELSNSST